MEQKNTMFDSIVKLIGIFAISAVAYLGFMRIDTFLRNQAVNECGHVARYEKTLEDKAKVIYPMTDIYQTCLKDKGY